jgi:hypothetical protein
LHEKLLRLPGDKQRHKPEQLQKQREKEENKQKLK